MPRYTVRATDNEAHGKTVAAEGGSWSECFQKLADTLQTDMAPKPDPADGTHRDCTCPVNAEGKVVVVDVYCPVHGRP